MREDLLDSTFQYNKVTVKTCKNIGLWPKSEHNARSSSHPFPTPMAYRSCCRVATDRGGFGVIPLRGYFKIVFDGILSVFGILWGVALSQLLPVSNPTFVVNA